MGSEIEIVEQRLKSFTDQLETEYGILERLVYKYKNQHRRCSYFQYILKVRRDLKLLKLANLVEILEASFLVINGNRPKQKVQLLESLKRKRCTGGKYNFLERLLGVTRLLSQMIEPLLKTAMEISTLLARSFFMKFSLTVLAVLARIRVLIQQMLLDAVLLYNTVSSLSQKEQTVKLNQEGFEVFREYYPRKEEATTMLECVWQTDKYVLMERIDKKESNDQEKDDDQEDLSSRAPNILYENIEVLLAGIEIVPLIIFEFANGLVVDESWNIAAEHPSTDPINSEENPIFSEANKDKMNVEDASDSAEASTATANSLEDAFTNPPIGMNGEKLVKKEAKKKVAFVAVKPPPPPPPSPSSCFNFKGTEKNEEDTGGNKKSRIV